MRWPSGHTYWVHYEDLRVVEAAKQPAQALPLAGGAGGAAGAHVEATAQTENIAKGEPSTDVSEDAKDESERPVDDGKVSIVRTSAV